MSQSITSEISHEHQIPRADSEAAATTSEFESKKSENQSENEKNREGFSNPLEFVLTALGLAVGLGNIWRFPTRAFENGGSAFLIPYLICAILFGLPGVYLEMLTGQYQGVSPPIVFRRIAPFLEGIGWMPAIVASAIGIYYILIISWVVLYIFNLFRGDLNVWNKCDNFWNDPETCIDMLKQKHCWNLTEGISNSNLRWVFLNGSCQEVSSSIQFTSATEQYLMRNIIRKSARGMMDLGDFNTPVFLAMTFCWILNGLVIWKGMRIMGKIAYVTTLLPYALILIMFVRGITLEGASTGLYYFFLNPDYSRILSPKTWIAALSQLCFSLALGQGGLMSMASYNKKSSNCFINALVVIIGDTLMSVIGGAAVFSTLGFLAKQRNVEVSEVVQSGLSLSFVVYPEAFTQMPIPWLWAFLFFLTLFLLGISSEIALTEVFCTCLYDQYPKLRSSKWLVSFVWCLFLYVCGLIFSFSGGFYYFELFDEYSAGFSSMTAVTFEILTVIFVYGIRNFKFDLVSMIGPARNWFTGFFGAQSPYFLINWLVISPILGVGLLILSLIRDYPYNNDAQKYPIYFDIFGWILASIPVSMVPIFAVRNFLYFKNNRYPIRGIFKLQKQHVSYNRIKNIAEDSSNMSNAENLPENEPWESSVMRKYEKLEWPKNKSFFAPLLKNE
ncbi:unnamed protein product [Caenorhabditis angaria]|uniref:Transporter n=1 Tax=Caenorhabditis angaria TaxID=860376 RepID=A0A9P1IHJ4_9PELO|nr:unnamed protein product [Caenorhabditis angaria]